MYDGSYKSFSKDTLLDDLSNRVSVKNKGIIMSLIEKLKKNSTLSKRTNVLSKSEFLGKKEFIRTQVPMLNVALSGRIDGGLSAGLTVLAGPSKHFKTNYALMMAAAYQKAYEDGVILLYDSEYGITPDYLESFGIDPERVVHVPLINLEEFKFDIVSQLDGLTDSDHVLILLDSLGNLASKKELEDALNEKAVVDMQRAKHIKSVFRMVTPYLNLKNIPMIVINHTYDDMGGWGGQIVSGGCLLAGTKIQMSDGSLKNVEDIVSGELVKTLDGDKEVTYTWNPETLEDGEPECYEVEFEDGYKVICSDKHKFLVNGEWTEAKDLIVGQEVKVA